ncbi:TolB family protein [Gilvimarinus xylanilyticus]|uniref:Biopolymer transporter TolR n=1 Tax=Gilvimarinus xylanilyticus TaxID=2944139 RepID=A0A9X2I452_9GAMM|nr:hypothetical protein [Gilvimarinus xylanilyticus]MCP8900428.1 hypothetical protein [Gilvimarinus xylanilyticus]
MNPPFTLPSIIPRGLWGLIAVMFMATYAKATEALGQFEQLSQLGTAQVELSYDSRSQVYQMQVDGQEPGTGSGEPGLAWRQLQGDFIVRAEVHVNTSVSLVGWQARATLESETSYVQALRDSKGEARLEFGDGSGADAYRLPIDSPQVLQLERRGNRFIMSAAQFGQPFVVTSVSHRDLPSQLYVGLALWAPEGPEGAKVSVRNLRYIKPAPDTLVPYQEYIGSRLEVLDMTSFKRRVLHSVDHSIQAPNWSRDGKSLIYNADDGLLYRYQLESGKISRIETGFANANNNDHVLSWDGQTLGISHHAESEQGRSTIYTLPLEGSVRPTQITRPGVGHSYLHGFSPDDKALIFTADRGGQYDIYSVDIASGAETQLTNTTTLDDGSEFSPDGQFIYFNSNRTGVMQLWRMRADGSEQTQLTFDEYNDWFPHVSPDGKTLVFLSYDDPVDSADHPFYKRVYLRQIPAAGGSPEIIGYVYGGQGSLNVHSWSPDGSHIAFVSNSERLD